MATVAGIDISYWNAGIDWPKVRAAGQRFVFAKASEGETYADPTFDDNWEGARSAGLLRGAYHFIRANLDAKKQANTIIAIKYGTTVAAIAFANNIANINAISAGQVLIIP